MTAIIKYIVVAPANTRHEVHRYRLISKITSGDQWEFYWLDIDNDIIASPSFNSRQDARADLFRRYNNIEDLESIVIKCKDDDEGEK